MKSILLAAAMLSISVLSFGQTMMQSTNSSGGTGAMTAPNEMNAPDAMMAPNPMKTSTGHKVFYSGLEDAKALAARGPVVLMFAADWCPTCQADLRDINANGSRLGNATVVVVDYDKEKALEQRYGVTIQHTYVQIDARGTKLGIWSGGGVDGILDHLTKM